MNLAGSKVVHVDAHLVSSVLGNVDCVPWPVLAAWDDPGPVVARHSWQDAALVRHIAIGVAHIVRVDGHAKVVADVRSNWIKVVEVMGRCWRVWYSGHIFNSFQFFGFFFNS
jgi:hypothetical protein